MFSDTSIDGMADHTILCLIQEVLILKPTKGKYELFEVGEELVFSDSRDRIKNYAIEKGVDYIDYKMSANNKEGLKEIAKEI